MAFLKQNPRAVSFLCTTLILTTIPVLASFARSYNRQQRLSGRNSELYRGKEHFEVSFIILHTLSFPGLLQYCAGADQVRDQSTIFSPMLSVCRLPGSRAQTAKASSFGRAYVSYVPFGGQRSIYLFLVYIKLGGILSFPVFLEHGVASGGALYTIAREG